MKKHFVQEFTNTYKDGNGVEQTFTEKKLIVHKTEDEPFYLTFLKYVSWIYGMTGVVPIKLVNKFMELAAFNTGRISLTSGKKQEIIEELGISEVAFYKSMNLLLEQDIIRKHNVVDSKTGEIKWSRGEYLINPDIFWKGELNKRKELQVIFKSTVSDEN